MSQPPPQPLEYQTLPKEDIRGIAYNQKILLYCILGEIFLMIGIQGLNVMAKGAAPSLAVSLLKIGVALAYIAVAVTAAVFVFRLAIKLYGAGVGIAMGVCSLIPCVGLIILLVMSQKATTTLQRHGIPVGLLGAQKRLDEI